MAVANADDFGGALYVSMRRSLMERLPNTSQIPLIHDSFDMFDLDGSGFIDRCVAEIFSHYPLTLETFYN